MANVREGSGIKMYVDVSARKVAWWVRLLAILFLFVAAAVAHFTVSKLVRQGWPEDLPVFDLLLLAYGSALFGYVALTGRPPVKWFPIAALKLQLNRK